MMISSSLRTWAAPLALGLLAALAAACEPGGDRPGWHGDGALAPPPLVGPPPRYVVELPAESELPFPPRHFVEVAPDLLVAADPHAPVLWRLRLDGGAARLERAHELSPDPRARVAALSAGGGTLAALERGGRITLWDPLTWARHGELSARAPVSGRFAGMASLADGTPVLLFREAVPDGSRSLPLLQHVLRLVPLDGAPARVLWTDTPVELVRAGFDQRFLSAHGRSLALSGELPPRVLVLEADSPAGARTIALEGAPPRRVSAAERAELEAEIRAAPAELRRQAWVPELYPAVSRAWTDGDGILVWAAAAGETMLLERYCGGAYRGTLLTRRSWREVAVLPTWVVAVSDVGTGGDMRLELFERAGLEPRCP
ncbi:MAG TPA: hypothetical protein VMK65_00230 [Longimicrobiales bacterium]|nr:hypothetical protein [Longimicrobiales bacterium]